MADDNRWNDRERDWRDDRGWEARGRGGAYASRDERWRQMHQDRRHEGPAGYNDSGPIQGGWEFGDEAQGGERGQGYQRYGYGRGGQPERPEDYRANRQYGPSGSQRWRAESRTPYGAHTPYGYRGRNEFDDRGRGGDYAEARPDGEGRSWLERAGERVSAFFGADDTGSHRGRGPKGYRRSDDRIREDINDRLTDDAWLDASDIEVQVRETEVTLSGAVHSREDKRRAEDIAESVSGVRNELNNLRVEGQDAQTTTGRTASSTVQDVASGKDQKGLGAGRQASTD